MSTVVKYEELIEYLAKAKAGGTIGLTEGQFARLVNSYANQVEFNVLSNQQLTVIARWMQRFRLTNTSGRRATAWELFVEDNPIAAKWFSDTGERIVTAEAFAFRQEG